MHAGLCEDGIFVKIRKEAEATFGRHQNRNKESLKQNKEGEFGRAGKLDPVMAMRSETFPGTCRHHGKGTGHF